MFWLKSRHRNFWVFIHVNNFWRFLLQEKVKIHKWLGNCSQIYIYICIYMCIFSESGVLRETFYTVFLPTPEWVLVLVVMLSIYVKYTQTPCCHHIVCGLFKSKTDKCQYAPLYCIPCDGRQLAGHCCVCVWCGFSSHR